MTTHDHPYHELLFRMDLAMLGSCTCLTKTPAPAFHKDKCRYRVLREASALIAGFSQPQDAKLADEWKAKAEAYDAMLRDFAFRHSAGGYNSEGLMDPDTARDKLDWIVSVAITHAKAALSIERTAVLPKTPQDVLSFLGPHFVTVAESPDPADWQITVTVHDILSAFRDWRDFPPKVEDSHA